MSAVTFVLRFAVNTVGSSSLLSEITRKQQAARSREGEAQPASSGVVVFGRLIASLGRVWETSTHDLAVGYGISPTKNL